MSGTQLRVYQLPLSSDEQQRWVEWWAGARAVREQFGFRIVCALLNAETGVFTWVVEHDGDFAAAEKELLASPERAEVFARDRPKIEYLDTPMVSRIA